MEGSAAAAMLLSAESLTISNTAAAAASSSMTAITSRVGRREGLLPLGQEVRHFGECTNGERKLRFSAGPKAISTGGWSTQRPLVKPVRVGVG